MPVHDYPGERPELLKSALELLDQAGVPLTQVAEDLQMTPRHIRRLADIDDPQPKLTLVKDHPDNRK